MAELIAKLQDNDVKARRDAGLALIELGPRAEGAVPELIVALKDDKKRNKKRWIRKGVRKAL